MNVKRIVLYILIAIILFWLIIIVAGFHFYTVDIPTKIPWILILLFGLYLFLSSTKRGNRIAISIVFPIILLIYIPVMWWVGYGLFIGIEGDLHITKCEYCNKKVISYFNQNYWGGAPFETTGIGETYLGGLIYKTTIDTTYFAEYQYAPEVENQIVLPNTINPKDLVFVWTGQNILLVFKDGGKAICLPLKYKNNTKCKN